MATQRKPPRFFELALALSLLSIATATVIFEEQFDDGWEKRWLISDWKKNENAAGKFSHTSGNWNGNPNDKGIQTTEDYKYYAISAEFPRFSNENKTLVFQFSVKHEQKLNCGGGYMKLLSGKVDQKYFGGDTPYRYIDRLQKDYREVDTTQSSPMNGHFIFFVHPDILTHNSYRKSTQIGIMFGPDICGEAAKKVHAILSRDGKNHNIKKDVSWDKDQLKHMYTFIIRPDASYNILIDNEEKESGSLFDDWDILPPREIRDPEAKKPDEWDDRAFLSDPEDKKPEGYDDIPKEIPDPESQMPEDWNDEDKGEWKAPLVRNPEYMGPWKQKKMRNPSYRGKWEAPMIENPDYEEAPDIYIYPDLKYAAIELWQVKAGTLFDNILICDDHEYAKKVAEETWGKFKDAEKEAFEQAQEKKNEEESIRGSTLQDDEDGDEPDDDDPDNISKVMNKEKGHVEI